MLKIALVFMLFAVVVQGCHDKRRRKRAVEDLNIFFDNCMETNGITDLTWASVVDFVINHGSWYFAGEQSCDLLATQTLEATCWRDFLDFQLTPPDRDVAKQCVCNWLLNQTGQACPAKRKREILPEGGDFSVRDDDNCPYVSAVEYTRRVQQANLELQDDRTTDHFQSVIKYVQLEGLCVCAEEYSCNCNLTYHNTAHPRQQLPCESCWPTRLYSMVRDDSPLKPVLFQITTDLEYLSPPC